MALSSDEHDLLTATCENMNAAANSCRDVLEMLRSLGNTGVVDIAAHNSATGRHADDPTLLHSAHSSTSDLVEFGPTVGTQKAVQLAGATTYGSLVLAGQTKNRTGSSININTDVYLTDANGSGTTFSADSIANPTRNGYQMSVFRGLLADSNSNKVYAAVRLASNRHASIGDGGGNHPYGTVAFQATTGTLDYYGDIALVNAQGVVPYSTNTFSLGHANLRFKDAFLVNQPNVSSDRRSKTEVSSLGSSALELVKALNPVSFKLVDGEMSPAQYSIETDELVQAEAVARPGQRTHWGFIAQEVKEAMTSAGIEDAAVWCLADKDDPDSQQSLRYEELLAPLVKAMQVLAAKVEALEAM